MSVAIIGAGVSGLSCAYTLERLGISYDVYERNHTIGSLYSFGGLILQIIHRPYKDPLNFIAKELGIFIEPLSEIKKIIIKSPKREISIEGKKLGYIVKRGQEQESIENQLAKKINSKINFNINADYRELSNDYDYVIVATGNSMIAKQLTEVKNIVSAKIKGGIALGDFEPHTVYLWLNTMYARSGFGYLIPLSKNKASIILVATYTQKEEVENLWHTFLYQEKLNYEIIETFETELDINITDRHQIDNIYLVGNAGGFLEPSLGFGILNALESAVYAVESIKYREDYEKKIKKITDRVYKLIDFRKMIDNMKNEDFDRIVKVIGNPIVQRVMYKSNLNVIKYLHFIMKITNKVQ